MPTAKQIAANRLNAKKATGPRTAAGKAACRYNSLKHGLYAMGQFIFDETPEALAELTAEYQERHTPSNPAEHLLVETLVHSEWRLRRMRRVEANLWESANFACRVNKLIHDLPVPEHCSSGECFLTDSPTFERLQRVVNSCERDYRIAMKDLVARAHLLKMGLRAPQPEDSTTSSAKLAPLRQSPEPAPPSAPAAMSASASAALAKTSLKAMDAAFRAELPQSRGKP